MGAYMYVYAHTYVHKHCARITQFSLPKKVILRLNSHIRAYYYQSINRKILNLDQFRTILTNITLKEDSIQTFFSIRTSRDFVFKF